MDGSRLAVTSMLAAAAVLSACANRSLGDGGHDDGGTTENPGPDSASASDSEPPDSSPPGSGPQPDPSTTTTPPPPDPSDSDTGPGSDCLFLDHFSDVEVHPIASIAGEQTVILEVEALPVGAIFAAGYFGLARTLDDGETWELLDAPELLSQSFLQLRNWNGTDLWALANGAAVYSEDLGESWQVADLGGASQLFFDWGSNLIVGGEEQIGFADIPLGPTDWIHIDALDGDSGNLQEGNVVLGFTTAGGWFVAAERFGRVARAPDAGGPWHAVSDRIGSSPELLELPEGIVVALSSDGHLYRSSDYGATWPLAGYPAPYPEVAEFSTQLVLTDDVLLVAAATDGFQFSCDYGEHWNIVVPEQNAITYDLSIAPDGSIWAAGYDRIYRIRRS